MLRWVATGPKNPSFGIIWADVLLEKERDAFRWLRALAGATRFGRIVALQG
jgi:hypothetical protein